MNKPKTPQMRAHSKPKRLFKFDRLTLSLVLAFLVLSTITTVVAAVYLFSGGGMNFPGTGLGQMIGGNTGQSASGNSVQPWQGTSRVTILVMGLDYRNWEADNKAHSDSMWLFTIDPVTKSGGMLSIPRDTWVNIPGYGESKINNAYFYGEVDGLEGGGAGLAKKTVEEFMGVPIDFYAVVDFKAFTDLIDRLGGIWINVPEEITVDPLGPGNTVILQPGRQKLSGPVALGYARNRYTGGGDFDRMNRQKEVILAVRDQIMQPENFPKMIAEAPQLYKLLASNIHTDMNLQQAVQLALLVKDISPERIQKAIVGPDEVTMTTSWQGWSILLPDMDKIKALRDRVFSAPVEVQISATADSNPGKTPVEANPSPSQPPAAPSPEGSSASVPVVPSPTIQSKTTAVRPGSTVKILVENGTLTTGLAKQTRDYLKSLGLTLLDPADANNHYDQTMIIDYSGNPETVDYLAQILHVNPNQIFNGGGSNTTADIIVILGEDWAENNSLH